MLLETPHFPMRNRSIGKEGTHPRSHEQQSPGSLGQGLTHSDSMGRAFLVPEPGVSMATDISSPLRTERAQRKQDLRPYAEPSELRQGQHPRQHPYACRGGYC